MYQKFKAWLLTQLSTPKNIASPAYSTGTTGQIEHETAQNVVPYDENLLERSRIQWQFGDWESLVKLDRDTLQHHPDRAKLALLTAAGHLQQGNSQAARQFTRLAQDWGCSRKLISQILISGAYNTLGRMAVTSGNLTGATTHFNRSIEIGSIGCEVKLLARARMEVQVSSLRQSAPFTPRIDAVQGMDILLNKPISEMSEADLLIEEFLVELATRNRLMLTNLDQLIRSARNIVGVFIKSSAIEPIYNSLEILFYQKLESINYDNTIFDADVVYFWGIKYDQHFRKYANISRERSLPVLILEDGFLRSICPWTDTSASSEMREPVSFSIDFLSVYTDALRPTSLESLLNSNLSLSAAELRRAAGLIKKIVDTKLSKYNSQPIFIPNIGRANVKKILVIDQNYGDTSIKRGLANEETFRNMLNDAILENPDSDIIIKTHPDEIHSSNVRGYYSNFDCQENIYVIKYEINPLSLLDYVDKVYVCTSQMGFEAVMCGKETHVFGIPFYAGWGFTKDRQLTKRRTKKRSVIEFFYIVYILYVRYVNPALSRRCEIEEAIDYLLSLRQAYFLRNDLPIQ